MHYQQSGVLKRRAQSAKCETNLPFGEKQKTGRFPEKRPVLTSYIYILYFLQLCFALRHKLAEGVTIDDVGDNSRDYVRDKLCPDDTVEAEEVIHNEEERNIYDTLTERGEDKRLLSHTHSLEAEGDLQVKEHKGYGETEYTKEVGGHCHGFGVAVEHGTDICSEQLEQQDADSRKDHRRSSRNSRKITHTLMVARGKVIRHEGHHTLTETEADVHRKHIYFLRYTDCGDRHVTVEVAVARRKVIDNDIRHAGEE